jgi:hypothetical protein
MGKAGKETYLINALLQNLLLLLDT